MKNNNMGNEKSGLIVPENYFNNLEDVILNNFKHNNLKNYSKFRPLDKNSNNMTSDNFSKKSKFKIKAFFSKRNNIFILSIIAIILLLSAIFILDKNKKSYDLLPMLTEDQLIEKSFKKFKIEEKTIETYILNNLDTEDFY